MLEAAVCRFGQAVHQPFGLLDAHGLVPAVLRLGDPVQNLQKSQVRAGRIDVAGRKTALNVGTEPVQEKLHKAVIPVVVLQHRKTVQPHSLRPVPFLDAEIAGHIAGSDGVLQRNILVIFIVCTTQMNELVHDKVDFFLQCFVGHDRFPPAENFI